MKEMKDPWKIQVRPIREALLANKNRHECREEVLSGDLSPTVTVRKNQKGKWEICYGIGFVTDRGYLYLDTNGNLSLPCTHCLWCGKKLE